MDRLEQVRQYAKRFIVKWFDRVFFLTLGAWIFGLSWVKSLATIGSFLLVGALVMVATENKWFKGVFYRLFDKLADKDEDDNNDTEVS